MKPKYDKSLLVAKMLRKVPYTRAFACRFNRFRHKRIQGELSEVFERALRLSEDELSDNKSKLLPDRIWVFWWQGMAHAPASVNACVNSVMSHAGKREVIVLTQDNVCDYAVFPDRTYKLLRDGAITLTHFSDLLRYNLLSHYGGLWLDASMYVVKQLPLMSSDTIYTCGGYPDPFHFNVSEGRWLGGLVGGPAEHPMFRFMDSFFSLYWKENDRLIDYFLIDYAVEFAWRRDLGGFSDDCERAAGRNPMLFNLRKYLDAPFDQNTWMQLCESTDVFMISYKWVRKIIPASFADVLISQQCGWEGIA